MSKKKKKARKQAIKDICNNPFVIGKFRDIFGMQDYKKSDVSDTIKRMIKEFLEEGDVSPDDHRVRDVFRRNGLDIDRIEEEDDEDEFIDTDEFLGRKISPKVIKKKNKGKLSGLFG